MIRTAMMRLVSFMLAKDRAESDRSSMWHRGSHEQPALVELKWVLAFAIVSDVNPA